MRIHPIDRSFLSLDTPTTPQTIALVCIFDRMPDRSLFRDRCAQLVRVFPRMSWKIARSEWRPDDTFDLDHHVQFHEARGARTPHALLLHVEEELARGLSLDRPLWRFSLIGGAADGPAAGVLKVHHALADGMGGLAIFDALTAEQLPEPQKQVPPVTRWSVRGLLRLLWEVLPGTGAPPRENSVKRRLFISEIPLERLRHLRSSLGASLNDVYLGLASVVLGHAYPGVTPYVLMPVSTRRLESSLSLGNHLTVVGVRLPANAPIKEAITTIAEMTAALKASGAVYAYALVANITARLPIGWQRAICRFLARRATCICTNIPYARSEKHLAGARILSTFGLPALLPGHGLAFSFMTYAGKAFFAVVTDPAVVPNGAELCDRLTELANSLGTEQEIAAELPAAQAAEQ